MSSFGPETQVSPLINTRNKLERLLPIYKRGYRKLRDRYRIKLERRRSRVSLPYRTTLWRCKSELIDAGFAYVTRKGHMPSTCELLALTWFPLDVSPKFDEGALHGFVTKAYARAVPQPMPTIKPKTDWTLPNGGRAAHEKTQSFVHV